jgi:hypothetical protein
MAGTFRNILKSKSGCPPYLTGTTKPFVVAVGG